MLCEKVTDQLLLQVLRRPLRRSEQIPPETVWRWTRAASPAKLGTKVGRGLRGLLLGNTRSSGEIARRSCQSGGLRRVGPIIVEQRGSRLASEHYQRFKQRLQGAAV